jgi:hypothetical protein
MTETESSLRNVVFSIEDRAMNNVQICDSYNQERWIVYQIHTAHLKKKNILYFKQQISRSLLQRCLHKPY